MNTNELLDEAKRILGEISVFPTIKGLYLQYREDKEKEDKLRKVLDLAGFFSLDLSEVDRSLQEWPKTIGEYDSEVSFLRKQLDYRGKSVEALTTELLNFEKSEGVYKLLIDKTTGAFFGEIEQTLNQAFQFIYELPSKRVQLLVQEFRGSRVLKVQIVEKVDGVDYLVDLDDEGFSVQKALGLVFLIYFILYSGLPRVIFLDETVAAFQSVRLEKLMTFLKYFVDKFGFSFVYVSHDDRVMPFTDRAYRVVNGVYQEVTV